VTPTEYLQRVEAVLPDVDPEERDALVADLRAQFEGVSELPAGLISPEQLAAEYRRQANLPEAPPFGAVLLEVEPLSVGVGARRVRIGRSAVLLWVLVMNGGLIAWYLLASAHGEPLWQTALVILLTFASLAAVGLAVASALRNRGRSFSPAMVILWSLAGGLVLLAPLLRPSPFALWIGPAIAIAALLVTRWLNSGA
jgi:hypothetical protein